MWCASQSWWRTAPFDPKAHAQFAAAIRTIPLSVEMIAEQCIAMRLRMLSRAVTRIYNRALRPYGLTTSQMNILVAIACLGEAKQHDVCQALHLGKSTLSRDVAWMRRQGWLDDVPGADGRVALLRITPAGKRLVEEAIPAWQQAQAQATTLLGERQVSTLGRAATALRKKRPTTWT
jgi:DNA-binding MarR family transcriptional regulator